MNLMKLFGFDNDEDDYDDSDDYQEERPKKQSSRKEGTSKSSSGSAISGKLIIYKMTKAVPEEDKRRLRDAFNDGTMILIDMHEITQRDYDEFGHNFIMFMDGIAFGRGGEGRHLEPAQHIIVPRTGMFEIWPKEEAEE